MSCFCLLKKVCFFDKYCNLFLVAMNLLLFYLSPEIYVYSVFRHKSIAVVVPLVSTISLSIFEILLNVTSSTIHSLALLTVALDIDSSIITLLKICLLVIFVLNNICR